MYTQFKAPREGTRSPDRYHGTYMTYTTYMTYKEMGASEATVAYLCARRTAHVFALTAHAAVS